MTDKRLPPRIAPLAESEWSEEQRTLLSRGTVDGEPRRVDWFMTLVRHPRLYKHWSAYGSALLYRGLLSDADREVADVAQAVAGTDKDLPPALESMMAERQERAASKSAAAREAAIVSLPVSTWREIQQRATTTGIVVELGEGGLHVRAELAPAAEDAADAPEPA